jgi:hypothetical protein
MSEDLRKWLDAVGIKTLEESIKEYKEEGFVQALLMTCEMISQGEMEICKESKTTLGYNNVFCNLIKEHKVDHEAVVKYYNSDGELLSEYKVVWK